MISIFMDGFLDMKLYAVKPARRFAAKLLKGSVLVEYTK